ncbi:MAG: peptidylprolyl isomerase [Chloroflexota bacterium]|nr:peptidylprolyl isomerase [Chloroflexota bacterium]
MLDKERIQAANLGRRRRGSNMERDQQRQRIVIILGVILALLIIAIPVYGWVTTFIMPPRVTIVRVNDTSYNMGYLLKMMRMVQRQSEAEGQRVNLGTLPFQFVNDLATDELVLQGSQAIGIKVTEEELTKRLHDEFIKDSATDPDFSYTEASLLIEFRERYRQFLNQIQLSAEEYEEIAYRTLYREKLEEHLGATIPDQLPQVHLFGLGVKTAEEAEEVRTKFARGTPFADLVAEYSVDPEAIRTDGEIDWVPRDVLDATIKDFIFDELVVGEISEPVPQFNSESNQEFYVLYHVSEREELRDVSEANFENLRSLAVDRWVTAQRELNDVTTTFDSNQYAWLAKKLQLTTNLQ